jgi:choline dehydrogenase-like flavoprotein
MGRKEQVKRVRKRSGNPNGIVSLNKKSSLAQRPVEEEFTLSLLGTCRMGSDTTASVINPDHRTHDIKKPVLMQCQGARLLRNALHRNTTAAFD